MNQLHTRYRLVQVSSGKPTKPFTLTRPMTIGSDCNKCQIQLKAKHGIQPEHCRIEAFNGKVWLVTLPNALTLIHGCEFEGRIELKNKLHFQVGPTKAGVLYLETVPTQQEMSQSPASFHVTPTLKSNPRNDAFDTTSLLLSTPTIPSEMSLDGDPKKHSESTTTTTSSSSSTKTNSNNDIETDNQSQPRSTQKSLSSDEKMSDSLESLSRVVHEERDVQNGHFNNKTKLKAQLKNSSKKTSSSLSTEHNIYSNETRSPHKTATQHPHEKSTTNSSQSTIELISSEKKIQSNQTETKIVTLNENTTPSKLNSSQDNKFNPNNTNTLSELKESKSVKSRKQKKRQDVDLTVSVSPRYHGILKIGNFEVPRKWLPDNVKLFEQSSSPSDIRRSSRPRIATDRYYPSPPSTSTKRKKKKNISSSLSKTQQQSSTLNPRESILEIVRNFNEITQSQLIEIHQQKYGTLSREEIEKTIDLLIFETKDLNQEVIGNVRRLRLANQVDSSKCNALIDVRVQQNVDLYQSVSSGFNADETTTTETFENDPSDLQESSQKTTQFSYLTEMNQIQNLEQQTNLKKFDDTSIITLRCN